jgi:hypothetical protein
MSEPLTVSPAAFIPYLHFRGILSSTARYIVSLVRGLACSRSRLFAPLSPRPVPKTVPKKPTPRDPPAPAMDSVHSPARTDVTPFAFTMVARRCVPRRPPDPSASRWRWARVSSGLPGFYFTTVDAAVQRSSSACPVRPSAAAAWASVLNVSIFATARRVLQRVAWSSKRWLLQYTCHRRSTRMDEAGWGGRRADCAEK